jgi:hypothetical protein
MKTHSRSVRFSWVRFAALAALGACVLWCTSTTRADIVELYDGRRFEGKIFEETPSTVRIDTVVAGVRAKIGVPRRQVKSIQKLPLPEGFFDLEPKAWISADISSHGIRPATVSFPYGCGRALFSTYHTEAGVGASLLPQERALLYIILETAVCVAPPKVD